MMSDIFVANNNSNSKENQQVTNDVAENDTGENPPSYASQLEKQGSGSMVHLFTSYCEKPDDITFENQDENEKVLLFIRKDLITNIPWIIAGILLIAIPIIVMPVLSLFHIPTSLLPSNYSLVLTVFYYLFVTTFLFINFITWYFNIDIVTEKRVIDIDFEGIVYKNIAATKLSLVQDVSYTQIGVVRTLFDYGDVLVQTAGTIDNFTFEAVPRPEDAVHVVENLIGKGHEQL